jgi:hypothetical protein
MKRAILVFCCGGLLAAQTMVEGGVYDVSTGAPLEGVSISSGGPNGPVVRTDAAGHFRLQFDTAYASLMAIKSGYLQGSQFLAMRSSKALSQVRIELKPEAVITGTVRDEDGFPVRDAYVEAMYYRTVDGRQTLTAAAQRQSDDLGAYRIDGLPGGRYFLRVFSNEAFNWDARFLAQFFGGSLQPDENHAVEAKSGDVSKGADIRMVRFEGVTVSGRLEGVTPDAHAGPRMVLLRGSPEYIGDFHSGSTRSGSDMNFTLRHVPPGNYRLHYGSTELHAGDVVADVALEVADHDVSNLVLAARVVAPIDLEGKIALREGGAPGAWIVSAQANNGRGATAHANGDGSFVLKGLLPQHYRVTVQSDPRVPPSDAMGMGRIVSLKVGDSEVQQGAFDLDDTTRPMRITATRQYAAVGGIIVDSQGAPIVNTAVVFLSDRGMQGGFATTDDQGNFQAALTDAGDYRVYLADDAVRAAGDDSYRKAHQGDFPIVHATLGPNPPVRLVRSAAGPL